MTEQTKPSAPPQSRKRLLHAAITAALAAFVILAGFGIKLLHSAGEFLSPAAVVAKIDNTYGLYDPAWKSRVYGFKQALYTHRQPAVIVLGGKAARLFSADMFKTENGATRFVNMGGMNGFEQTRDMARHIIATHPPEIFILGIDAWWFAQEPLRHEKTFAQTRLPAISWADMRYILKNDTPDVGLAAIARHSGYDRHGVYHAPDVPESGVQNTQPPAHDAHVRPDRWDDFAKLVDEIKSAGTHLVLYIQPMAPAMVDALNAGGGHDYITAVREKAQAIARARHIPLFDFHDVRFLGAADCEFENGADPRAAVYARMMLHMALRDKKLRTRADLPKLGWDVRHGAACPPAMAHTP